MSLQAPRFRHDPVLEACLSGTHRMLNGEPSGGSVLLVQQALIDSGYHLPKFGPDGKYGDETAAAVAKYKADRGILPSDGVVGKKTMAALDDEFKDEPQPMPPSALGVGEMEIEDYMLAVKDAEAGYPFDSAEQLLTRIRQMYYPGTNPVGLHGARDRFRPVNARCANQRGQRYAARYRVQPRGVASFRSVDGVRIREQRATPATR